MIDRAIGRTREPGFSDPTAKTLGGAATLKWDFPAGGTFTKLEPLSIGVGVYKSFVRCEAKGYKTKEIPLAPYTHFKPKDQLTVKIEINLERE